jgi:hypothetical protein
MQTAGAKPIAATNPHVAAREGGDEPEWVVWLTVAVALVLGYFLMLFVTNQTNTVSAATTTVSYPATWVPATEKGAALAVADTKGGGIFGDRMAVYQLAKTDLLPGQGGLTEAAGNWSLRQQSDRVGYRSLTVKSTKVGDKDAVTIETAYLMDSPFGASAMPALMHGYATIVQSGDKFYVLTYSTADPDNDRAKSMDDKLLSSWRVP